MPLQLQFEWCIRVALAALLSALVGLEREWHGQAAGLRTHMLVGLGASLFTVLSLFGFGNGDHGRVAAQIVTGIGFLGAGAIIQRRSALPARHDDRRRHLGRGRHWHGVWYGRLCRRRVQRSDDDLRTGRIITSQQSVEPTHPRQRHITIATSQ